MPNRYRRQVLAALQAAAVEADASIKWYGSELPHPSEELFQSLSANSRRQHAVTTLRDVLYQWFYCRGLPVDPREWWFSPRIEEHSYLERLVQANAGNGSYDGGWRVVSRCGDEVIVERSGLRIWASRDGVAPLPAAAVSSEATVVSVRRPKGSSGVWPGFYTAFGDTTFARTGTRRLVRVYWNLSGEGAVRFLRVATNCLNGAGVPFSIKAVSDPAKFDRCDSVILYIQEPDFHEARELLLRIRGSVAQYLGRRVPALVKAIDEGIGVAEDPGLDESFGMHRCRLLADAMVLAQERSSGALGERLNVVDEVFAREGIVLNQPYLNPDSEDLYRPLRGRTHRYATSAIATSPSTQRDDHTFLEASVRIATRLTQDAIWHGDLCNWIGAEEAIRDGGSISFKSTNLGPSLYGGTSGIALFLGELYRATGESVYAQVAVGAIRHALSQTDRVPSPVRIGAYTGISGVALVAAHLGVLLEREDLVFAAQDQVLALTDGGIGDGEFDLISGRAGAILVLVMLSERLSDKDCIIDFCLSLGDHLLSTAHNSGRDYSWESVGFPTQANLTGYSHGVAGAAHALLELYQLTGDHKYRDGAVRAFEYERRQFDPTHQNWPDFRLSQSSVENKTTIKCQTYWCHGAPGIALSRLRAVEILDDTLCRNELQAALETTEKVTALWLDSGAASYSLCHGIIGNAEVLRLGSQYRKATRAKAAPVWLDAAHAGVEKYSIPQVRWPCGVGSGEPPSLMSGLAGIGYYYLSLHAGDVPSVLFLRGGKFLK